MIKRKLSNKNIKVKRKIPILDKERVLKEIKKELYRNTYIHKFGHYCFECELSPNDSAKEMEERMRELHL